MKKLLFLLWIISPLMGMQNQRKFSVSGKILMPKKVKSSDPLPSITTSPVWCALKVIKETLPACGIPAELAMEIAQYVLHPSLPEIKETKEKIGSKLYYKERLNIGFELAAYFFPEGSDQKESLDLKRAKFLTPLFEKIPRNDPYKYAEELGYDFLKPAIEKAIDPAVCDYVNDYHNQHIPPSLIKDFGIVLYSNGGFEGNCSQMKKISSFNLNPEKISIHEFRIKKRERKKRKIIK